ncbi:sensor domain-containing phosphodiesterase [Pseudoduganella namucuonensis]|uniref:EAL domain, c-di-GMP-specific phosphodiesterase class I (Or its enzymatically inactive variant) n=1 Tax=Pseudoduganella namucuonensis TaxID=1035707 RepID=A0A1I7KZE4_9BURK|nr:sensor domain-containing phosphodiesterase [Pseudoduganella namucuonensis]SFV02758.1 EAL domain, c-di-GMP-specific phosphodiesterase class I (or its enzymatically inactive variant) [Pseudoduganella namucuonensis]
MHAELAMPNSEVERVAALRELGILDSHTSEYFDTATRLAMSVFGTAGAYISLIDSDRQWIKASVGFCTPGETREESFCDHTIRRADVMVVDDALLDPRFVDNPAVAGPPHVRFYAGAPLLTPEGYAIGALCVIDSAPRAMDPAQRARLREMAAMVMSHISLRRAVGHVDAVSGMPNKYQLEADLKQQGREAAGEERVLVYLDLPDAATAFEIASVLGVAAHDELVRSAGQKLKRLFRGRATVYHVTDARFAVLSGDGDTGGFVAFARAQEPALQEPLMDLNVPLNLPSFGGIVVFRLCPDSAMDAPRKASSAVNQALLAQRRWSAYDGDADARQRRAFRLLNDVREGLRADAFQLVYQPKHDLASGACLSAEALLRWRHPELGFISPAEFIPLIEKTALIKPLTDWVLRTAIRQAAQWHAAGRPVKIAINLSALNFEEGDICQRLAAACAESGLPPRYVEIECTEGVWMESPAILQTLHGIRALGMSLALDDFGTGYSNFAYLQKVPATVVKVDQSLVRNVHTNPRDQRIVRSLIALARELGYEVVAEGVETAESLALIREWGCHVAQGYHFAKPLPAADFIEHIARH